MAVFRIIYAEIFAVKFVLWTVGLCVSAIPLVVSIQTFPGGWSGVFNITSYAAREAEVLYIGIALGAVTMTEAIDLLASTNMDRKKGATLLAVIILCASVFGGFLCYTHYGIIIGMRESGAPVPLGTLETAIWITAAFAVMALVSKTVIWGKEISYIRLRERDI